MKHTYRFCLEPSDYGLLRSKAEKSGYFGRGWLGNWLKVLANYDIIIMSEDTHRFLALANHKNITIKPLKQ